MSLPKLELETSGFDTMLGFMHQPDEPKSLSSWEEVGNPLILHNNLHITGKHSMSYISHGSKDAHSYHIYRFTLVFQTFKINHRQSKLDIHLYTGSKS